MDCINFCLYFITSFRIIIKVINLFDSFVILGIVSSVNVNRVAIAAIAGIGYGSLCAVLSFRTCNGCGKVVSFAVVLSSSFEAGLNIFEFMIPTGEGVVIVLVVVLFYNVSRSNSGLAGNNGYIFFAAVPNEGYGVLIKNIVINFAVMILIKDILDIFDSVVNIFLGVLVAGFIVLLIGDILNDVLNLFFGFIINVDILDIINEIVEVLIFNNLVLCSVFCIA